MSPNEFVAIVQEQLQESVYVHSQRIAVIELMQQLKELYHVRASEIDYKWEEQISVSKVDQI
jgi:hypothetical protein